MRRGLVEQVKPFLDHLSVILPDRAVFEVCLWLKEETVAPVDKAHGFCVWVPENMIHLDIIPNHPFGMDFLDEQQ